MNFTQDVFEDHQNLYLRRPPRPPRPPLPPRPPPVVVALVVVVGGAVVVVVVPAVVVGAVVGAVVVVVVVVVGGVVVGAVVVSHWPNGCRFAWPFSVAMSQAPIKLCSQAASSSAKSSTASAAGPVGLFRFPQSLLFPPQQRPRSPPPGFPPQYSPPLAATAPGMVLEVSQAQQLCSVAITGPPF